MAGTSSGMQYPPHHDPAEPRPRTRRKLIWLLAVVSALLLAAVTTIIVLLTTEDDGAGTAAPSTLVSRSAPSATSAQPSTPPGQTTPPSSTSPGSSATASQPFELGYQPLWPFATRDEVLRWEESHRSGGHQPWHLDAAATAQAFTTGYLGFQDVSLVTRVVQDSSGAHVGVGYRDPDGVSRTAAVLHLVRFGTEADAPWEVVGSDDTTFTLDIPAYGSRVSSPLTAGGHITGTDENIRVAVRQVRSDGPIGTFCCMPAGGQNTPWSASVSFTGADGSALTIVASTGGHIKPVERFAITGVRP